MRRPRLLPLLSLLALFAACREPRERGDEGDDDDDDGQVDGGFTRTDAGDLPDDDLVDAIGGPDTIDIATWNIENFPATTATPKLVADLITSLDLDLIAVEEIADLDAWEELLGRLPDHAGLISSHTYGNGEYQKVGFIYREDTITLGTPALIFTSQGYDFPRPPLQVPITAGGTTFTAIVLHLKAGVEDEDVARRTDAIVTMADHLETIRGGGGDAIALGDWNQGRTTALDDTVWAPIVGDADFEIVTQAAADGGEISYLGFGGRLIDHVVTTAGFAMAIDDVVIPRLDLIDELAYRDTVSDHLPVVVRFDP